MVGGAIAGSQFHIFLQVFLVPLCFINVIQGLLLSTVVAWRLVLAFELDNVVEFLFSVTFVAVGGQRQESWILILRTCLFFLLLLFFLGSNVLDMKLSCVNYVADWLPRVVIQTSFDFCCS